MHRNLRFSNYQFDPNNTEGTLNLQSEPNSITEYDLSILLKVLTGKSIQEWERLKKDAAQTLFDLNEYHDGDHLSL